MLQRILTRGDDHRQKKVNCSWFVGVEKRAVLREVTTFGNFLMGKQRCLQVIRKLLYLLNQGQTFTKTDAATVLASATMLLRFKDFHLRRLVYLIAKELYPIAEEEVGILEHPLHEDLCSRNITVRANAIRLLCRFTNGTSSIQTEVYLKKAIMDLYNVKVSSAGLVCALHLLKKDPGIGIKLCEQVGEVAQVTYNLGTFHALCLLFRMNQIESLGDLAGPHIEKILSNLFKYTSKYIICEYYHPLSLCLVIRFIAQTSRASSGSESYAEYDKYLKICMYREDNEFVAFEIRSAPMLAIEGLRSMKHLRNISRSEVRTAINRVRTKYSTSYNTAVTRFGGLRAIHELRQSRHLEADDDVAQVVKSITEAPATNNLKLRLRRRGLQH